MSDWQPIETAPKDGSTILLARFMADEVQVSTGSWNLYPVLGEDGFNGFNGYLDRAPTHWMPVPERPE
ncbi:hypothetical protein GGR04_001027 [Aureimonas pseudogalii]|uniref:DUF551 domain-containing protein n=1 Tax=Aureimonas pseudogalii TaxID=1744844 RepID=A0A7W6E9F9_9HYPH|nr:hypothetical protein [Aureimonas pseudogalii]